MGTKGNNMLFKMLLLSVLTVMMLQGFDFDFSKISDKSESMTSVNWISDIEKAREEARKQNKPLMIVVYQDGCKACSKFKKDIDSSNIAQNTLRRYVLVALNIQNASHDGYQATKTPTVFFETSERKSLVEPMEGAPDNIYDFVDYATKIELFFSEFKDG